MSSQIYAAMVQGVMKATCVPLFILDKFFRMVEKPCICSDPGCAGVTMAFEGRMHIVNGELREVTPGPVLVPMPTRRDDDG